MHKTLYNISSGGGQVPSKHVIFPKEAPVFIEGAPDAPWHNGQFKPAHPCHQGRLSLSRPMSTGGTSPWQVSHSATMYTCSVMDMATVAIRAPFLLSIVYSYYACTWKQKNEKRLRPRCRPCLYQFRLKVPWNRSLKAVHNIMLLT